MLKLFAETLPLHRYLELKKDLLHYQRYIML